MKSNFMFLEKSFPVLSVLGGMAETFLYSDTNTCLIRLGLFGETVINLMYRLDGIVPPDYENTHANPIRLLKKEGLIPQDIDDILYSYNIDEMKNTILARAFRGQLGTNDPEDERALGLLKDVLMSQ